MYRVTSNQIMTTRSLCVSRESDRERERERERE